MRTRIALTSILVIGGLMSFSGGALAVSELTAAQDNAGEAVYPGDTIIDNGEGEDTGGGVGGETESGGGGGGGADTIGDGTSSGNADEAVQPAAQGNSTDSGELPFTGYAAIPLLLIGVALLVTGTVLRRRSGPGLS